MIDIHCHTLFDVDDGSTSLNQTIKMIKMAKRVGVTSMCFTPHYMEDGYKNSKFLLEERLIEVKNELIKQDINMDLYLGEEVYIFPEMAERLEEVFTLNNTNYLLFELPLAEEVNYLEEVIYELSLKGIKPILAHPERYLLTQNNYKYIKELAEKGEVLLQINISSLIGRYGIEAKRLATKMLKDNIVCFASSDAHSENSYYNLTTGLDELEKIVGYEKKEELVTSNPKKVLDNLEVCLNKNVVKKSFVFNFFGKRRAV